MSKHAEGSTLNPLTLPSNVYDGVKNTALVILPAIGAFYFTVAQIWGLPAAEEVLGTIVSLETFLGALVGVNKILYKNSERSYDGVVQMIPTVDGTAYQAHWKEPIGELAEAKDTLTLKVASTPSQ